jgi:seryl-tRNA synthetase
VPELRATTTDWTTRDGLAVFGPQAVAVIAALDDKLRTWAAAVGAAEWCYPGALRAEELAGIDYFHNFPHLGAPITGLTADAQTRYASTGLAGGAVPAGDLTDARYVLPSAACYAIYFDLRDRTLTGDLLVTTRASCYRTETSYHDLRRLWNFQMREIVYLGERDTARTHLDTFRQRILDFGARLGLEMTVDVATDPFYRRGDSRALLQRLEPVKWEFVVDGCAIASVNYHRNFFGERCGITAAGGDAVFTSCVAFGLERWLSVLARAYGGDLDAVHAALVGVREDQ